MNHDVDPNLLPTVHSDEDDINLSDRVRSNDDVINPPDTILSENASDLPHFHTAGPPNFKWGSMKGEQFCEKIDDCYQEIVTWRRHLFKVPSGKQGQALAFVNERAKLFGSFGDATSMEVIALKAAMVLPSLILQKPSRSSKAKDHVLCIQQRLQLWLDGKIDELLNEVRALLVTGTTVSRKKALLEDLLN